MGVEGIAGKEKGSFTFETVIVLLAQALMFGAKEMPPPSCRCVLERFVTVFAVISFHHVGERRLHCATMNNGYCVDVRFLRNGEQSQSRPTCNENDHCHVDVEWRTPSTIANGPYSPKGKMAAAYPPVV